MRARLFVPEGMPDQDSGGEVLSPSQVYLAGILLPFVNAVELKVRPVFAPVVAPLFPAKRNAAATNSAMPARHGGSIYASLRVRWIVSIGRSRRKS
jgi:hypothetical protein